MSDQVEGLLEQEPWDAGAFAVHDTAEQLLSWLITGRPDAAALYESTTSFDEATVSFRTKVKILDG